MNLANAPIDSLMPSPVSGKQASAPGQTSTQGAGGKTDFAALLGRYFDNNTDSNTPNQTTQDVTAATAYAAMANSLQNSTERPAGDSDETAQTLMDEQSDSDETDLLLTELAQQTSQQLQVRNSNPQPADARRELPPEYNEAVQQALGQALENYLPAEGKDERQVWDRGAQTRIDGLAEQAAALADGRNAQVSEEEKTALTVGTMVDRNLRNSLDNLDNRTPLTLAQSGEQMRASDLVERLLTSDITSDKTASVTAQNTAITGSEPASTTQPRQPTATPVPQDNPVQRGYEPPKGHEAWLESMGSRLVAMIGEKRQEASIRLDPPELGTLNVRLVVEDSTVSVQFQSAIPQVREMLEAQSDRLRYALAGQGLDLVNVNVGQDGSSSQQQNSSGNSRPTEQLADGALRPLDDPEERIIPLPLDSVRLRESASNGFINTFA